MTRLIVLLLFVLQSISQNKIHISDMFRVDSIYNKRARFGSTIMKNSINPDTSHFFVRNILDQKKWDSIKFYKVLETEHSIIWLENDLQGNIKNQIMNQLEQINMFLELETKSTSIDSTLGMFELSKLAFGSPPNIDGDHKLDILLLDIRDHFLIDGSYIAGFFDPNDQTNEVYSNKRDIIYIDVYPGIVYEDTVSNIESALATLAHEYQHLIHFNYETSVELTFLTEGLAEVSEILHGFQGRSANLYLDDLNQNFFSWGETSHIIYDYQRSSLFHYFLYEKYNLEFIKKLSQDEKVSIKSYNFQLEKYMTDLKECLKEFHLRNLLNGESITYTYVGDRAKAFRTKDIQFIENRPFVNAELLSAGSVLIYDLGKYSPSSISNTTTHLEEIYIANGSIVEKNLAQMVLYYNSDLTQAKSHQFSILETDLHFTKELRYDDGNPDAVSGSTFLFKNGKLNAGFSIEFRSPEFELALNKLSIFALFESEFTNFASTTKKQLLEIKDDSQNILYSDTLYWSRSDAVFGFEDFLLKQQVHITPNTTFNVNLKNIDSNYINLAVDYSSELSKTSLLYPNSVKKSFENITFDGFPMSQYNVMLFLTAEKSKIIKQKALKNISFKNDSVQFIFPSNYDEIKIAQISDLSSNYFNSNKMIHLKLNDKYQFFIEANNNFKSDIYNVEVAIFKGQRINTSFGKFKLVSQYLDKDSIKIAEHSNSSNSYLSIKSKNKSLYSISSGTNSLLIKKGNSWLRSNGASFSGSQEFRINVDTVVSEIAKNTFNTALSNPYNNPTKASTYLDSFFPSGSQIITQAFNILGQRIYKSEKKVKTGSNYRIEIDWQKLQVASGIYFVNVQIILGSNSKSYVRKVIFIK
jgi:hypothetical protein